MIFHAVIMLLTILARNLASGSAIHIHSTDSFHSRMDMLLSMPISQPCRFQRVASGHAFVTFFEWPPSDSFSEMRECSHAELAETRGLQLDAIRWEFPACIAVVKSCVRTWLPEVSRDILRLGDELLAIGGEGVYQQSSMLIQQHVSCQV